MIAVSRQKRQDDSHEPLENGLDVTSSFSLTRTSRRLQDDPVTFRYKKEIDPARALSFGLIAEEVAKIDSDLITRDEKGNPQTVRYEAVNAMLLNEFLKEHCKNEEQQATIMQLKSTDAKQEAIIAQQQKQIEALTAGLQKVSAQLELNKPAPRTVSNQ